MKKAAIACIFFVLLSGIAVSSAPADDAIKIGVMLPLTGRQAPFGRIQQKAALMATDKINAGGGIKNKKIDLMVVDTRGNPDVGRAAIRKLINRDKVVAIGGGFSNAATWAAISIAQENKIPFLVSSAAADKITEQGWEYIFRLNQPASERLNAVASFVSTVAGNIRTVAIIYAGSLKASANARNFFQKTGALGLKSIARERFEAGTDDFRPLLARVKVKNPDLVYAAAENVNSAALLVRQAKELELNPKLLIGGGNGFVQPEFAARAGKAAEHIVCTALWTAALPYPAAGIFQDEFSARFKAPPEHYGAEAYAGISVIADALKRTKVLTPEKVRDALAKTDLMTVMGPVKFISYHNKSQQNKLPAFLMQWFNGQLRVVWPKHLATRKAVYPIPK